LTEVADNSISPYYSRYKKAVLVNTMRRPGDNEPDPPGGRAAERLREFLDQHMDEDERKKIESEHGINSGQDSSKVSTIPGKKDKAS
jgi:hypothetical protein